MLIKNETPNICGTGDERVKELWGVIYFVTFDPGQGGFGVVWYINVLLLQIAASKNRVYLNAGSLMLNIADKDYDPIIMSKK